jgi:hypothetical protein
VNKTPSITKALDNRQEKLSAYMEFIDKNNLLDKSLGDTIYTTSHDESIFSSKTNMPKSFPQLPNGIDSMTLKRVMRVLISGVDMHAATDPNGEKHTADYKIWVLGTNASTLKDDEWKKKKISDIVPNIAQRL